MLGTAQCGRGVQGPPNNIVWEGTRWCHRDDGGGVIVEQFKDAQRRSFLSVKATHRSDAGSAGSGDVVVPIQPRRQNSAERMRQGAAVEEVAQRTQGDSTTVPQLANWTWFRRARRKLSEWRWQSVSV